MNNVTNLKNDRIFIKEGLTKYLSRFVVFVVEHSRINVKILEA